MHKSKHYIPLNFDKYVHMCNQIPCHPRKFSCLFPFILCPSILTFIFSQHISFSLLELHVIEHTFCLKFILLKDFVILSIFSCISRSFLFIDKFFWHKKFPTSLILCLSVLESAISLRVPTSF